jgi:hypothetical protein
VKDEGGIVESEVDGMADTVVSHLHLALVPLAEGAVYLQPPDDGTGARGIAGTRAVLQVTGTAGHHDGVTVVEGDIVTRQDDAGVDVATLEVIEIEALPETGNLEDS